MPKTVAIIGGGVMGLSCGAELLSRGYSVYIYDGASTPYDTATANAAGLLKPFSANFQSGKAKLQRESLASYPSFLDKFSIQADYSSLDYYLQKRVGESYNPYAAVHQLSISKLLEGLTTYIKEHGGTIKHQFVTDISTITADAILVCAGAGTGQLINTTLFGRWRQGLILSQPQDEPLKVAYEDSDGYYIVPKSATEVYVGAQDTPDNTNKPVPNSRNYLQQAAINMYSPLKNCKVRRDTLGCVARMPRGDKVHMGQVESAVNTPIFAAAGFGGVGVCMAPIVSKTLADAILDALK